MSEFDKKSNVLRAYRIIERFAIIKIKNIKFKLFSNKL